MYQLKKKTISADQQDGERKTFLLNNEKGSV